MISFLNLFAFIVLGTAVHLDSIGQISKDRFYNRVDSIIKSRMGNRFPSVSVAIVIDGKLAYTKAYGYANQQKKIPATTNTCYQIGSSTKIFIGNLLAKMIVQNKVFLFDSIQKYFPANVRFPLDSNGKAITIFNLATHTASIPRYPGNLIRTDGEPILGFSQSQLYTGINLMKLSAKVGTRLDYSNFGFGIIGTALENISGKSLSTLLAENIFSPLKMENTSLVLTDKIKAILAIPYRDDDTNVPTQPWDMGYLSAAGNIFSNAEDLSKFLIYQINESDAATKLQHQSFFPIAENVGYGLGCFTGFSKSKNTRVVYHGGDVDGYASDCNFLPDRKMGVVILTNCGIGRAFSEISNAVFNEVFQYINKTEKSLK